MCLAKLRLIPDVEHIEQDADALQRRAQPERRTPEKRDAGRLSKLPRRIAVVGLHERHTQPF